MINKQNVREVILNNHELLPKVLKQVQAVFDKGIHFKYKPVQSIQNYLFKHVNIILFPSKSTSYCGMMLKRNSEWYMHINTLQPKIFENYIWVSQYYNYEFEKGKSDHDKVLFINDGVLDIQERMVYLFVTELLIHKEVLKKFFQDKCKQNPDNRLEINVIRLMNDFKLPYKLVVMKLAQDGLITLEQAESIIDFDYSNNLPIDFDLSILESSKAIKIGEIDRLLEQVELENIMSDADRESIKYLRDKHVGDLELIRNKKHMKLNT